MDIKTLETVISVIDCGSIAGAAKKLNVSPTAVSLRVQSFEKQMECELFNREAHAIKPNHKLDNVTQKIRAIINQARELKFDLQLNGISGELRLGAISTALTGIIPSALEKISLQAPNVRLKITPGDSKLLYDKLTSGDLDAAILVNPPFLTPKSIRTSLLRREPLGLLSRQPVSKDEILKALQTEPYIRYYMHSWGGQLAQRYLDDYEIYSRVSCDIDSLEAIDLLVSYGQGVSLVPQWLDQADYLSAFTIVNSEPKYCREIVLAYDASCANSSAINLLRETLISI